MSEKVVIEADFTNSGSTHLIIKPRKHICRHLPCTIDVDHRLVECLLCGAVLDPFQVLLEFASQQRSCENYVSKAQKIRASIDALTDEERRLKARIRSARKKAGA